MHRQLTTAKPPSPVRLRSPPPQATPAAFPVVRYRARKFRIGRTAGILPTRRCVASAHAFHSGSGSCVTLSKDRLLLHTFLEYDAETSRSPREGRCRAHRAGSRGTASPRSAGGPWRPTCDRGRSQVRGHPADRASLAAPLLSRRHRRSRRHLIARAGTAPRRGRWRRQTCATPSPGSRCRSSSSTESSISARPCRSPRHSRRRSPRPSSSSSKT